MSYNHVATRSNPSTNKQTNINQKQQQNPISNSVPKKNKAKSTTFSDFEVYHKARENRVRLRRPYFSAAVLKPLGQGNITEERVDWSLWWQSIRAHGVWVGLAAGAGMMAGADPLNLKLHTAGGPLGME